MLFQITKQLKARIPEGILLIMESGQNVLDRWSGAAPFWEKYRDVIRQMFAPIAQALVEEAHFGSGDAVLDIATGP